MPHPGRAFAPWALLAALVACRAAKSPAADPALSEVDAFIAAQKFDTTRPGFKTDLPVPPELTFDPTAEYVARLETSKGLIRIRLMPEVAPYHVASFLFLARLGFYDGLTFHRVIPGFMAQGGCPLGDGTGGPGYEYDGEFDVDRVRHDRPFLASTANVGPGTDGSQFFITFAPAPWLDGTHTIFGEVTEGQETVRALERCGTDGGIPTETLILESVTIEVGKSVAPKAAAR